jgi:RimJ/RimL family protein N-acetyltransferase
LILRPFSIIDAKGVQRLAGDKKIASTTINIPHPYEDDLAENWIKTHREMYIDGASVTFAITLKESGELIGAISLMGIVENHLAELGYWIGVPYWNYGYCTEAGKEVIRYAFKDRGLNRIHSNYFSRNPASGRVLEKLGMTHEGTRKQHILKWGKYEDEELMGILRSDWENKEHKEF